MCRKLGTRQLKRLEILRVTQAGKFLYYYKRKNAALQNVFNNLITFSNVDFFSNLDKKTVSSAAAVLIIIIIMMIDCDDICKQDFFLRGCQYRHHNNESQSCNLV